MALCRQVEMLRNSCGDVKETAALAGGLVLSGA
jgi:hypothetical protein